MSYRERTLRLRSGDITYVATCQGHAVYARDTAEPDQKTPECEIIAGLGAATIPAKSSERNSDGEITVTMLLGGPAFPGDSGGDPPKYAQSWMGQLGPNLNLWRFSGRADRLLTFARVSGSSQRIVSINP